ncbi:MAG: UDP-glucose 4-epimerase GalE [Epsilonproteobacteria bacterium]|nr:MAG: UDP-glucose 4-epimerase GalE [Campylobacterota bacterium]
MILKDNKPTVLVTGGAGYIGSHVVKKLLKTTKNNIIIIDNISTGFQSTLNILSSIDKDDRMKFYNVDLSDTDKLESIFMENKVKSIIHFAAFSQVGESMIDPLKYFKNNTLNTINLIDLCIKYDVKKFIFSSTAAVYGEPTIDDIPIKETMSTNPINPYGHSKLMSEQILQDTSKVNNNFKFVILRYFNVCGADLEGQIGECHNPETHLIPLIAKTALEKRESISIYGDDYDTKDGTCIRDYIHIEDLAQAHLDSLNYLDNNDSDIFNCGYGYGYSVKEIVDSMKKISNNNFEVIVAPRRDGDPAILIADNTKIINKMNWKPKYNNLELICKTALEWEKQLGV